METGSALSSSGYVPAVEIAQLFLMMCLQILTWWPLSINWRSRIIATRWISEILVESQQQGSNLFFYKEKNIFGSNLLVLVGPSGAVRVEAACGHDSFVLLLRWSCRFIA